MRYTVTLGDETLVEGTDYTVVDNSDSATEVGEYTLTIQAVDTETEDAIGTVTVTVSSTNIQDITLTINVNATNKIVPTGTPGFSKTELTYGKKLSDAALTVNDKWPAGTLEWVDEEGNVLPGATEVKANTIYKSEGIHSFEIVWTDGTASTSFTVAKNTSGNNAGSSANTTDTTIKAPKTGDTSNDALWIVLLVVVSLAGLSGFAEILAIRKKKDFE